MNSSSKIIVNGELMDAPSGLNITNYHSPDVQRFRGKSRCDRPVFDPHRAYEEAVKLAVGAKKSIDLSDIIKAGSPVGKE